MAVIIDLHDLIFEQVPAQATLHTAGGQARGADLRVLPGQGAYCQLTDPCFGDAFLQCLAGETNPKGAEVEMPTARGGFISRSK